MTVALGGAEGKGRGSEGAAAPGLAVCTCAGEASENSHKDTRCVFEDSKVAVSAGLPFL